MALRSKLQLKQIVEIAEEISSAVAAEATLREAADAVLQTAIDDEATARGSADSLLQTAIDDEVTARTLAVSAVETDLASEVTNRMTAVSAEESRATLAETTIANDLLSEVSRATLAETTLQANIDIETGRINAILAGADVDVDTFLEVLNVINAMDLENDDQFIAHVVDYEAKMTELDATDVNLENLILAEQGRRYDDDTLLLNYISSFSESVQTIAGDDIVSGEYTVTLPVGKVLSNHKKLSVTANGADLFPAATLGDVGTAGDFYWNAGTSLLTFESGMWDETDVLKISFGTKSAAPTLTV